MMLKHYMLFNEDKMTNPLYEETKNLNINFRSEEVQYVVLKEGIDGIPYEALKMSLVFNFYNISFQYCFDIA